MRPAANQTLIPSSSYQGFQYLNKGNAFRKRRVDRLEAFFRGEGALHQDSRPCVVRTHAAEVSRTDANKFTNLHTQAVPSKKEYLRRGFLWGTCSIF